MAARGPVVREGREAVILVDEANRAIGEMEKLAAHKAGRLHRAFSVFVFHPDGRLMLQQRARGKYHSGGLWSNTCCSHPRPGESVLAAAKRRLREEMGFSCELRETHAFVYRAELGNGLVEHECDHILVGTAEVEPVLDRTEAEAWRWVNPDELMQDLKERPERYTYWLRAALPGVRLAAGRERLARS